MLPLADGFPASDESQWRKLAERALKGAPWERLVGKTADGAPIHPLYGEPDIATATDVSGIPGAAPFIRGALAARDPHQPWTIRQAVSHPDPAQANSEILADLQGGVAAIELVIDPNGEQGIAIRTPAHLERTLENVLLDLAPPSLDAGAYSLWAADLLATHLRTRNLRAAAAAFNVDPIGALMRAGALEDVNAAANFAARIASDFPNASALRIDARPIHEAGGSEGQELGAALAIGIHYLRALAQAGVAIDDVSRLLLFTLSVGPDAMIEAAKLRALRLCWARVTQASGANERGQAARVHAFTSRRMLAKIDPWTNILRNTAAAFAAAIGGAQAITVRPLTDAIGLPTPFARRIARNTQLVLMEESHLGRVADPAGGSWFVEKMTRDLAEAGWAFMQKIEIEGGIVACLERGWLQEEVKALRDAQKRDIALRKTHVTGITDFPLLGADLPAIETPSYTPVGPLLPPPAKTAEPLPQIRWAAPFEAARERGERANLRPAFFATLGKLTDFSPRSQFARNLLAAGGVASHDPEAEYPGIPHMCAALNAAQTPLAVIVGSDEAYASDAAETAAALKASGADWVILAGRPGEREEQWRKAGIDQFIFAGRDALESLDRLHTALKA
ncbi:MAG: methylmalonyl-CoA mutase [Hyphomonadaceae bacterium]|nr:methylmalonyl-CoA mutase [Hyphomonadaceae bacterium]